MKKEKIVSIAEKNRIINNIINCIINNEKFLIMGHKSPDEDCIASMVAIALLITKFNKDSFLCLPKNVDRRFQYLLNICRYNSIGFIGSCQPVIKDTDVVFFCDTPKPSMLEDIPGMDELLSKNGLIKIEIDHHLGGDSEYIGDREYSLVTEASSAAELVGHILLKLRNMKEVLEQFQIKELFSRNIILAILTGIVGDTGMGKYIKSRREWRYYRMFSSLFNSMLAAETVKDSNFSTMEELYEELKRHSKEEEACYNDILVKKNIRGGVGFVFMDRDFMKKLKSKYSEDTIVSVTRAIADNLAEESGKVGLVSYYDNEVEGGLLQFRLRRGHSFRGFDLRNILYEFNIENGGGHEGAIGFRIPSEKIKDARKYIDELISSINAKVSQ